VSSHAGIAAWKRPFCRHTIHLLLRFGISNERSSSCRQFDRKRRMSSADTIFGLHSGCTNRRLLQKLQEPAPSMRKEANMARILSHIVTEIDHPLRGRISRVESGSHRCLFMQAWRTWKTLQEPLCNPRRWDTSFGAAGVGGWVDGRLVPGPPQMGDRPI
jgi:hypothetical protein